MITCKIEDFINIFDHLEYRTAIRAWVESQPSGGRGLYKKMADQLSISHVLISQILAGKREMSMEQAFALTRFLGLSGLSRDYFMALVSKSRAGTEDYRRHWDEELDRLRRLSQKLSERLPSDQALSEVDKAKFYSDWAYSAVRLACAMPDIQSAEAITTRLSLPLERVNEILEFLLSLRLIERTTAGLRLGVGRLHLEAESPFVLSRQQSWRLKAAMQMNRRAKSDLFYTGPMAISREHAHEIREAITQILESISKRAANEPAENLFCLNVDLFEV